MAAVLLTGDRDHAESKGEREVALTRRYALMQIRTFVFVGPARSRATPRSSRRIALTAVGERVPELDLYRRGGEPTVLQATPNAHTVDDLGVSRGSEVGAAAVSRPPVVVDEAPLVAVCAVGDVFAL